MKIGYIGLGKMGKNMVLHLLEQGIEIVAWNRSLQPRVEVAAAGATAVEDLKSLILNLKSPRVIWLMLPAGDTTDEYIDKLIPYLTPDDLIIDGANSYYKDTLRRFAKLKQKNIRFMDIGVSGGPSGARTGACLMIGGDKRDYQNILELIKAASAPNAYGYFGDIGAGHFAKMVHNGIEYGMMQAIAEGAAVLKNSGLNHDLKEVFRVYNNRSVIESRLVGWAQEALSEDPDLEDISSKINHTGEGEWTIKTANELEVEVPIIEGSFKVRLDSKAEYGQSKKEQALSFRNKVVSALRGKFGHHPVNK